MVHAPLNRILHLHMTWTNHASGKHRISLLVKYFGLRSLRNH